MKITSKSLFDEKYSNKVIEGTSFIGNYQSSKFYSKIAKVNVLTGQKDSVLSYKIGLAIAESQKNDGNFFLAEDKSNNVYIVGIFQKGTVANNIILYPIKPTGVYGKNIHSNVLWQVALVERRYNESAKSEINKTFSQINFDGIIDSNQSSSFLTLANSLYCNIYFSHLSKIEHFAKEEEVLEKLSELNFTTNLTGFIKNNKEDAEKYNLQTKHIFKEGMTSTVKKLDEIPFIYPEKSEKKNDDKSLLKEYKKNDFSIFTEGEIKQLPEALRLQQISARALYEENKEFLTLEDYYLIEELSRGDVTKMALLGPAGVGKTTKAKIFAGALNQPFILIGGSQNLEEQSIFGYERLTQVEGGTDAVMVMNKGLATLAIEHGCFLLFDEINTVPAGVVSKFNTILDDSKLITLDNGDIIKAHPKFRYAEAMNIGSGYHGTGSMNLSHFDRMDVIYKVKAKSSKEEALIVAGKTGYSNLEHLEKMCNAKNQILNLILENGDESEQITSIRRVMNWVRRASKTGEFLKSSLNTILSHLSIYEDDVNYLDFETVRSSSGVVSQAAEIIEEAFMTVEFDYDKYIG